MGIVGLGSRGFNLLDGMLAQEDVRVLAICDVHQLHYRDRPWGNGKRYGLEAGRERVKEKYGSTNGLREFEDYRELCRQPGLDVVVVATPDHWHALCTLEAISHGKDVYCEKPITHTFREGQRVYQAVKANQTVFQTGSQQRSDAQFQRAVELVRYGHLGKISKVEVGLPAGYDVAQGDTDLIEPPSGLDYEMWCGPAPKLPYMRARHHRWWRGHRAYGGGVLMDWIGHHNDIAHWALDLDQSGPIRVEAKNWSPARTEVYDTPHHYEIHCEYGSGAVSSISSKNRLGTKLIGDEGWVFVTRGKIEASNPRWTSSLFQPGKVPIHHSQDHLRDFIDCVRSREVCIAPAETGHRSITPGHLGYVSQQLRRPLSWDPGQERVPDDEEANKLLRQHTYREPWTEFADG